MAKEGNSINNNKEGIYAIENLLAKQVSIFNRVFLFLTIALVIVVVVIAGLTYNIFVNSQNIAGLKNLVVETLIKYQPDREQQNISRMLLREHFANDIGINKTLEEIDKNVKELLKKLS